MIQSASGDVTMSAGIGPATAPSAASGVLGKEDFLKLLVAQLSQQDPLNPQDGAEFVAQLAQFSSVEQLVNIRGGLDTLAMAQQASTSAQVVGFIGRDVVALGDEIEVGEGGARVSFSLAGAAEDVDVDILDANGEAVATVNAGACKSGETTVLFDGRDGDGNPLEPGSYHFRVRAKDADGATVAATPLVTGTVVGVTFEAGYPELLLANGKRLALADVIRVERESNLPPLEAIADDAAGTPTLDRPAYDRGAGAPTQDEVTAAAKAEVATDEPASRWPAPAEDAAPWGGGREGGVGPRLKGPDLQSYLERMMQREGAF